MKYRKKPVVIDAFRWEGDGQALVAWLMALPDRLKEATVQREIEVQGDGVLILTLEGWMRARPGDWIVCGVHGELYPVKPDIFAATYESADLETVIYVYRSPVERHLWLPDLPEPLILGPERAVEVRWLR